MDSFFFFDSKLTIADLSIFAILQGFLDPGIAESEMINRITDTFVGGRRVSMN